MLLTTVIFPFLTILFFRAAKLISNAYMHSPADRVLPLTATMIFYVWTFYFLQQKTEAPLFLRSLVLGAVISIVLDFAINFFYKVSVHTTAAAAMPGNVLVMMSVTGSVSGATLVIAILVALLIGLVRWMLGSHTIGQILLGYSIGFACQIAAWFILR